MKLTRQMLKKYISPRQIVIFFQHWSEDEVVFLEENYGVLTVKEIAENLHRSNGDIRYMIRVLKLENIKPVWTQEQTDFLIEHKDWPVLKLSNELGRSENAIKKKLGRIFCHQ